MAYGFHVMPIKVFLILRLEKYSQKVLFKGIFGRTGVVTQWFSVCLP
jgi:hypothetical protein